MNTLVDVGGGLDESADAGQAAASVSWDIHTEDVSGPDDVESLVDELLTRITAQTSDARPVYDAFALWFAPTGPGGERLDPVLRVDLYPPDDRAALRWLPTGDNASEPGIAAAVADREVLVNTSRPDGYEMVPAGRLCVRLETAIRAMRQYASMTDRPACVDWSPAA